MEWQRDIESNTSRQQGLLLKFCLLLNLMPLRTSPWLCPWHLWITSGLNRHLRIDWKMDHPHPFFAPVLLLWCQHYQILAHYSLVVTLLRFWKYGVIFENITRSLKKFGYCMYMWSTLAKMVFSFLILFWYFLKYRKKWKFHGNIGIMLEENEKIRWKQFFKVVHSYFLFHCYFRFLRINLFFFKYLLWYLERTLSLKKNKKTQHFLENNICENIVVILLEKK